MKIIILILLTLSISVTISLGQVTDTLDINTFKRENGITESACSCIDSILVSGKSTEEIHKEISACIDEQVVAYQLFKGISEVSDSVKKNPMNAKTDYNIEIAADKNSKIYQKYYYEIERNLMNNCEAMKQKVAVNNALSEKSLTDNPEAARWYEKAYGEFSKGKYKKAVKYYKKAVEADSNFVFAWDNLGLSYRYLNDYDNAIYAYQKSIEIDSTGTMPLQNIAVAYGYKKEYNKAVAAYEKLAELDDQNPEVYYGIGQIYAYALKDNEKALDNMCKAYNLYVALNSPYRTDAEKLINLIRADMLNKGQEDKFNEILKANNIISQ